ncbi:hypothetical protein ACLMJK_005468 [Lecanora helva]
MGEPSNDKNKYDRSLINRVAARWQEEHDLEVAKALSLGHEDPRLYQENHDSGVTHNTGHDDPPPYEGDDTSLRGTVRFKLEDDDPPLYAGDEGMDDASHMSFGVPLERRPKNDTSYNSWEASGQPAEHMEDQDQDMLYTDGEDYQELPPLVYESPPPGDIELENGEIPQYPDDDLSAPFTGSPQRADDATTNEILDISSSSQNSDEDFLAPLNRYLNKVDEKFGLQTTERTSSNDSSATTREDLAKGLRRLQSFPLLKCDYPVRRSLFHFALIKKRKIIPYYNAGSVQLHDPNRHLRNFNINLLLATAGDATLYQEALSALYSDNTFKFTDPRVMSWWLKRIGDNNVGRLRSVKMKLNDGPYHSKSGELIGHVRMERLWFTSLAYLKSRHKLEALYIDFRNWRKNICIISPGGGGQCEQLPVDEMKPKLDYVKTLMTFQGLKEFRFKPGYLINTFCLNFISSLLLKNGRAPRDVSGGVEEKNELQTLETKHWRDVGRMFGFTCEPVIRSESPN